MSFRTVPSLTAAKSFVVSSSATVHLGKVQGYLQQASAGNLYLQIHEAATLPSNGAVPAYVRSMSGNFDFSYDLAGEGFGPCLLALSTTEGTLTIATDAGDKATFLVEVEVSEPEITGLTAVPDAALDVTGVLTVWANDVANVGKRLYKVVVTPPALHDVLQLFLDGSDPATETPWREFTVTPESENTLHFGTDGLDIPVAKPGGVAKYGCFLGLSEVFGGFLPGTGNANIVAYYK